MTLMTLQKAQADWCELCRVAATTPLFNSFRRDPRCLAVVDTVTKEQGAAYLDCFDWTWTVDPSDFAANDQYGDPIMHYYAGAGMLSPTTLRYGKVLGDLRCLFGSRELDGFSLLEVGSGYGGQCRIICECSPIKDYIAVDVPSVLSLCKRYLQAFDIAKKVSLLPPWLVSLSPDLFISNYAFSELRRLNQDTYLERAILKSKRGYITYNQITPPEYRSYRADELLKLIPGSERLPEKPLTHKDNCIIAWGHNRS